MDSRYFSRLPFIITTNPTLAELKEPKDIAHARIYDRILERCAPVRFLGKTTYPVHIHFSTTSAETMSDKIKRMLKNEIKELSE